MKTTLRELSATERALHELSRIARELSLLQIYLQSEIEKEQRAAPQPTRELIDPRTRRPWRSGRKGGAA